MTPVLRMSVVHLPGERFGLIFDGDIDAFLAFETAQVKDVTGAKFVVFSEKPIEVIN